jgi:hypothetical protein
MLLLNEEQVSTAIRKHLDILARRRSGKRRRVALYAEREFATEKIFIEQLVTDKRGRLRRRAVGSTGPAGVKPIRGATRVGSEGLISFLIAQEKEVWPRIYMTQPGPDRLRAKSGPAGSITVVTDFIGSGRRVRTMLDKFWAVHSVKAWKSRGWIDFKVVAAAATSAGLSNVRRHRLLPEVLVEHIAPTIDDYPEGSRRRSWQALVTGYGPTAGRGTGRFGFGDAGALIAFSYRIPNNTPALIHQSEGDWQALYEGPAPIDLREVFGLRSAEEIVNTAAINVGITLGTGLTTADQQLVVVMSMLKGRWRAGTEVALAERTGLTVPNVLDLLSKAFKTGLITREGRLTDAGQALLQAGRRGERQRPEVPTQSEPYYPMQLRTPRRPSSTRRPSGRP